MARDLERRIARLEEKLGALKCPRCYGRPLRIVGIDPETNEERDETMPASGCPECGRPIVRTLQLVGVSPLKL